MKAFVAVTDDDWFRFLRALAAQGELEEVNLWQPSGSSGFRALDRGEPLLFKLHSPNDYIVGGGFYALFSTLPHSTAWEYFEERNGAPTRDVMERRIMKYRRAVDPRRDFDIGCILLSAPFFFEREQWIPVPPDWKRNIVRGKTYDLRSGLGAELWAEVLLRLQGHAVMEPAGEPFDPMFGDPILVQPRLGQGTFRTLIADTYQRRCAVTGERALPALDAAHIRSVQSGGRHLVNNGLLLRSDVHRLFDAGYVTVTPGDHRFRVSSRLKTDFDNGEPYYPLEGRQIWLPKRLEERPAREFLEWHGDVMFRG
jgi:putative restriction endonuclease